MLVKIKYKFFISRSSKRSRAPPAVYAPQDPEMEQIIKSIKKQEEEERKGRESRNEKKVPVPV